MKPINGTSFILCFLLSLVSYSRGLRFFVDKIPDYDYCGHFYCWTDVDGADQDASSIVGIAIYSVTGSGPPVKLASQSVFGQGVRVRESKENIFNATGVVSKKYAELTLGLRKQTYCMNSVTGDFVCELSYLNATNDANKIQMAPTTVNSESSQMCEKTLTRVRNELLEASQELLVKGNKIVALEKEVSRLENFVNVTRISCFRGEPYNNTREKFMLWNKIPALCDTDTDGGGWVIIQRRSSANVEFFRKWDDYKKGFGTIETDYWIGNDVIHNLTSEGYNELRVDMEYSGTHYYAHFTNFIVADEASNYRITVNGYSGTAGESLQNDDGMYFSTYDRDNDAHGSSCAVMFQGGWWYNACGYTNINGVWEAQGEIGNWWYSIQNQSPLSFSEIKIRHY